MKVMIVDDSQFMRFFISRIIKKYDMEVAGEASSGMEAIERYKELKPDVVTMDLTMNGISGMEATKRIVEYDPNAKIIICSAMGQQRMIMEALNYGAKGFVVKPFDEHSLINEINNLWSKR